MKTEPATLAPNWCIIGLDETQHWNIPAEFAPHIERILSVYAFNRNVYTHCCEFTPSYWLECLRHDPHTRIDTPDAMRERISEWALEVSAHDGASYFHVADIERAAKERPQWFAELGAQEDDANEPAPPEWVFESEAGNPSF